MHLEHGGRHIGRSFTVDQLMDYLRLFLAECNKDNIFGTAYGFKPHGNAHIRHIFDAAKMLSLHALRAVGKLLDMGVRVKKRGRLVKADVSV